MDTRITERPAFRLVGHAARVPLIHHGVNPHIQQHVTSIPPQEHRRLKALSATEPAGLLAVTDIVGVPRGEWSSRTVGDVIRSDVLPASARETVASVSERLRAAGVRAVAVTDGVHPDAPEGSELASLHGVADPGWTAVDDGLNAIEVPAGRWAVFRSSGPHPQTLQTTWAATATSWFPSNPWRLRPGPSIVAVLDRAEDFSTATTELWLPVEPA